MRRAPRVDNTAKELRAYAESLGFTVVPINGVIDCVLQWNAQRAVPCDWKSPGGELTKDQAKLVARGVVIRFISEPQQLEALKQELTR